MKNLALEVLKAIEKVIGPASNEEKISLLKPYCVTENLMSNTAPNSIFMHCLPAKVGYEVCEKVFRSAKSIVWRQAYNRMVAQKNLLQFLYE